MSFLPVNRKDMEDRGWDQVDFVLVTGDALSFKLPEELQKITQEEK